MNRKASNLEIMDRLSEYFSKYPDMRFGQALLNLGIVEIFECPNTDKLYWKNAFYEESKEILKRIEEIKKENI